VQGTFSNFHHHRGDKPSTEPIRRERGKKVEGGGREGGGRGEGGREKGRE